MVALWGGDGLDIAFTVLPQEVCGKQKEVAKIHSILQEIKITLCTTSCNSIN